ncbi:hypothetical protein YPPY64_3095 [Yersinia pestis PY-64]|nr:hypothetical protein YPPY11_3124 [Yersinia pestis PY-11]EIS59303.1 hypothetical protein YPPY64_3095 [Yersinia pestis PY-64]EIS86305.1 hypothetical protein YPPY76_2810 [Yersinia pestis PY-76]EIS97801.1 hypothetical protein YPPY90_3074 [Yersinia pestis PY-90]EIT56460.1 hypothetical protein YPPY103_3160 [Yersinia pestis PY-103]
MPCGVYTRHISSRLYVGGLPSPQSLICHWPDILPLALHKLTLHK